MANVEDKFVDDLGNILPDTLNEDELVRILGSILTAYSVDVKEAFTTLRVLGVNIARYYADNADNADNADTVCDCPTCKAARGTMH